MTENKWLLLANGVSDLGLLYVSHFAPHKIPMNSVLLFSLFLGEIGKVADTRGLNQNLNSEISELLALCCSPSYSNHLQGHSKNNAEYL